MNTNRQYLEIPEDEPQETTDDWKKGECFRTMGSHWWRHIDDTDMNCNDIYPIFLLYDGGKLKAWGIAMAHHDRPKPCPGKRFEQPGGSVLNYFFQPNEIPKCLLDKEQDGSTKKLCTQHVFFTNSWLNV